MAAPPPASSGRTTTTTTAAVLQPTTTSMTTNAVQRHTYTTVHTPDHTDFFHDRSLPLSAAAAGRLPIPRHDAVPSTSNKVVQQGAASGSHSGDRDINAKSESGHSGARGILASSSSSASSAPYPSSPLSPLTPTSSSRGVNAAFSGDSARGRGSYWLSTSASDHELGDGDKHMDLDQRGDEDDDEAGFGQRRLEPSSSLRSSAEDTLCGSSSSLSQKAKGGLLVGEDDSGDEDYEGDYHYRHHQHPHHQRRHSKYVRALCAIHSNVVDFFKRNTGLLLVTASQVFLSLMNVAVKKLNGIDPPVPTLEVRYLLYSSRIGLLLMSSHLICYLFCSLLLCEWYVFFLPSPSLVVPSAHLAMHHHQ